ncbi:MAG: Hint domain-containing protein [Pseudomonadota bacterium]
MGKVAVWDFGQDAVFDGKKLFAEANISIDRALRTGTMELSFTPDRIHRSVLLAYGVPGRDAGAFTFSLTHAGSISLVCTDSGGAPYRLRTPDDFVAAGERVQITMTWGTRTRFTAVNCSRRDADPHNPDGGYLTALPLRARVEPKPGPKLTFGAADGGIAPFFSGRVHAVTLSNTVDAPSVAPPSAQILRPEFPVRASVEPLRVAPKDGSAGQRPSGPSLTRRGARGIRITTAEGEKPLSRLESGDVILTRDDGLQRVSWVGRVDFEWKTLVRTPELRPIVVRKGSLGHGLPEADLVLAPWQRLLLPTTDVTPGSSAEDALVSARSLPRTPEETSSEAIGVSYIHFFCKGHTLAQINGVWVEAFNPRNNVREPDGDRSRALHTLFPELGHHAQPVQK